MKKRVVILAIILFCFLCGCDNQSQGVPEIKSRFTYDPISNYDSIEEVKFDEEMGWITVKKIIFKDVPVTNVDPTNYGAPLLENKGDLVVLRIENNLGRSCSIEIKGNYWKNNETVIRTVSKEFVGLSADDCNYFFFQSDVDFSDFSYELRLLDKESELQTCYLLFGDITTAVPSEMDPNIPEAFLNDAILKTKMKCNSSEELYFDIEILTFDNKGMPVCVNKYCGGQKQEIQGSVADACEKTGNEYKLPEYLTGELHSVVEIKEIMDREQFYKRMGIG